MLLLLVESRPKAYLLRWITWSFLYVPTFTVFITGKGLELSHVFYLKMILSIVALTLEIPSGYFADYFGRRTSILFGGAWSLLGFFVYFFGETFPVFVLGEICIGIGMSLVSGADVALVYDTLAEMGEIDQYHHHESQLSSCAGYSEALGGIVGGVLASLGMAYPYIMQAVLMVLFCISAFHLIEPTRNSPKSAGNTFGDFWKSIQFTLYESREVAWLNFYSGVTGVASFTMVWLSQLYMKELSLPLFGFGLVWFFLHILLGYSAQRGIAIVNILGERAFLIGVAAIVPVMYFLMSFGVHWAGLLCVAVVYSARGLRSPLVRKMINNRVPSEIRATVLSVNRFTTSLFFILLTPLMSYANSVWGNTGVFVLPGVLFALGTAVAVWGLVRVRVV